MLSRAACVPRIGHEVIVHFLDGAPDRPIVTRSVYNADNLPPYALPDHKTQRGIKSRSSKGGTADNFSVQIAMTTKPILASKYL